MILIGVLMVITTACDKEPEYENRYQLSDVTYFDIHRTGSHILFQTNSNDILIYEANPTSLFSTYNSNDEDESPFTYENITSEIPKDDDETIIDIVDFSGDATIFGYVFLTDKGNVYTYYLGEESFPEDYYIKNGSNNLIELEDEETIIQVRNYNEISEAALLFTTNLGNEYHFLLNSTSFNGFEYNDDYLLEDESMVRTLFHHVEEKSLFIYTSENRFLRYYQDSKVFEDMSDLVPLQENEEMIHFDYGKGYTIFYVTNQGNLRYLNLNEPTSNVYSVDINLTSTEIETFQTGDFGCEGDIGLAKTKDNQYYIVPIPDVGSKDNILPTTKLNFSEILSSYDSDKIVDVTLLNYHKNFCGYPIPYYDQNKLMFLKYILIVTTEDDATYLIGYEMYDDLYMTLQLK